MKTRFEIRRLINKSRFRVIWVFMFASCLSQIEFPTDNVGNRVVISGQVSPVPDQNIVQVGLTASTDRLPVPLSGAVIHLYDHTGNSYPYTENFSSPGTYFLTDFSGIAGTTYHLTVVTPEGETYESAAEKMPESVGHLTTHYEFEREEFTDLEGIISAQPFIKIYVNSSLPSMEEPTYVKWNVDEAFLLSPTDFPDPFNAVPPPCFIVQNADPQRITLINGEEVQTTSIDNFLVASRIIDWTFLERHYFTIYQSSLTKEAYEYWRKVNILSNQVGSIFDTPPAEITGNIQNANDPSEKVFGYFQASNQVFDRMYLLKSDLPFRLTMRDCVFDNRTFQEYPSRCLDCTSVRNSSYERPTWF